MPHDQLPGGFSETEADLTFDERRSLTSRDPSRHAHRSEIIQRLLDRQVLPQLLGNTSYFDIHDAVVVVQAAMAMKPGLYLELIECIKSARTEQPESLGSAIRLLNVLELSCPPSQLVLELFHLEHSEARIRSKITLILGRLTRGPVWLKARLEEQDSRVRANAIESVWGCRVKGLNQLLVEAAHDSNHRVAANAAVGLYKLGDVAAVPIVYSMLRNRDDWFRRAALWTVSQVIDLRYLPLIKEIASTSPGEEKASARQALKRLSDRQDSSSFLPRLAIEFSGMSRDKAGTRKLTFSCLPETATEWLTPPNVSGLDFVITEDGVQVEEYTFRPLDTANSLTAIVLTPGVSEGYANVVRCAWANASDSESLAILCPAAHSGSGALPVSSPITFQHGQAITDLNHRSQPTADDLNASIERSLSALRGIKGPKFVVVLASAGTGVPIERSVVALSVEYRIPVYCVVSKALPSHITESFRSLSTFSGGKLVVAETAAAAIREILSLRARFLCSYEISWHSGSEYPTNTTVVLSNTSGQGEGRLEILP